MLTQDTPSTDMVLDETTHVEEKKEEDITPEERIVKEKQEWIKQFRLKFCVREEFEITKNMIHPDGSLNQE